MIDNPDFLPGGSQAVAIWARRRGLGFQHRPGQDWFRKWEPYDTIVAAAYYFNACTWNAHPGSITLAEPWTEEIDTEPMDRTILGFASHPGLRWRAAMRVGEHFVTRVAFIENPPPPTVEIGDAVWDGHVTTMAASPTEANAAFTPPLRALLQSWGFRGHIEMRPGGVVVHGADVKPNPEGYERMAQVLPQIVTAALRPR